MSCVNVMFVLEQHILNENLAIRVYLLFMYHIIHSWEGTRCASSGN
jgi:hypothetical protein